MQSFASSISTAGSLLSESISATKVLELEQQQQAMEQQRQAKEQEVTQLLSQIKGDQKAKKQQLDTLQQELIKQEQEFNQAQQAYAQMESSQAADLQGRDAAFQQEMYDKEQQLQAIMRNLADLRNQVKEEKRKTDELEEMEEGFVTTHERMVGDLERLDEELDALEDDDDDELLFDKLMAEVNQMQKFLDDVDEDLAHVDQDILDQNKINERLKFELGQLDNECQALKSDVNIDDLQKALQQVQDEEKTQFEENLKFVNDLKVIEDQQQDRGKQNLQIEKKVNSLIDQNHVERKSRSIEAVLRDFEDKLREKALIASELKRKIDRLEDLVQDQGLMEKFGLNALKGKIQEFENGFEQLEAEKDAIRAAKSKIDAQVVGKSADQLDEVLVKRCLMELRDLEKVLDSLIQKENDILIIDRQRKTFGDIERTMSTDYSKKCRTLKDFEDKTLHSITQRIEAILKRSNYLESEVLPLVTKIADDEGEIEILKSKREILKELKRAAIHITEYELDQNLSPKITRVNIDITDLYELIELSKELADLETEVNGIDKESKQLEKRLHDFDQNLRQFEVELKHDFYEDSIKEIQDHSARMKLLDDQIWKLNEGIKLIEDAISQALANSNQSQDLQQLQENLEALKELRNQLEKERRELNRDGQILQSEMRIVNIDEVTPDELEKYDAEITRQREAAQEQERLALEALNRMKIVQQNAQAVAFKQKADKRQDCKQKLKQIEDNVEDLDRILSEISNALEMIEKDADYLKINQWNSPQKNRRSSILSTVSIPEEDLERNKDVSKQLKEIEKQREIYEDLLAEKAQLQKQYKDFQSVFDKLPLDQSQLSDYDQLYQALDSGLVEQSADAQARAKHQLENDLRLLKEAIEAMIEKFKQKKQLLNDCRREEAEKDKELQKLDSQVNGMKMRVSQMERELLNQQSMNLKTNDDKVKQSQDLLQDVQNLKNTLQDKSEEIEQEILKLQMISNSLAELGDKVVTLDDIKQIYKQLSQMTKIQQLKNDLKSLNEQITNKEAQVEQFIKDLLGGNLYECERKLKEADLAMDKITKKVIEINNSMNDFELEVKKGLQTITNDVEIQKEGKKILDANGQDRKVISEDDSQKNLIKKVLIKIKASIEEQNQNKAVKLTAATIEDYIMEIETCLKKADTIVTELTTVESQLNKRKDDWNSLLFKSGSKDALVEDLEKSLQDNSAQLKDLNAKLAEIDKLVKGFEDITKHMLDNPDYEMQQQQIQKSIDAIAEAKKQKVGILAEKAKIEAFMQLQEKAVKKGLKNLNIEDLQQLSKNNEDYTELLTNQNKAAETILKDLQKRRQKLGDADILENFKERVDKLNDLDSKLKQIDKDQSDLEGIIQEMSRINPGTAGDSLSTLKKSKQEITNLSKEKDKLQQTLLNLKEKLRSRDLNRDDLNTLSPIIDELKAIKKQLDIKDQEINKIGQNIKYLKNKYCGVDLEKKFDQFKLDANRLRLKLNDLLEDLDILKELNEEFDGYTSDAEEEAFIDKLGIDIRELTQKHHMATEDSETIQDLIVSAVKSIERSKNKEDLSNREIEERAKVAAEIEEDLFLLQKVVEEIDSRLMRNKKTFQSMHIKDKLRRRTQEVNELNKRLDSFSNQVSEMEVDMKNEFNKLHLADEEGQKLHQLFEELLFEVDEVQLKYDQIGQNLIGVESDINDLRGANMHQYEMLKGNIRIKKKILYALEEVKAIRQVFFQVKARYDMNKPKPKTTAAYKAAQGDFVDQLLADWINNNGCPVPIKRIGGGYYMFGTKKIYAKIINGKLVIRVGGGYMSIDEFMFYYGAQELNKMLAYQDQGEEIDLGRAMDDSKTDVIRETNDGKGIIGIAQMKKRLSPRGTSPRGPSARGPSVRAGSPVAHQAVKRNNLQIAQSPGHKESPRGGSRQIAENRSPSASTQSSFLRQGLGKQERNEEEMRKIEAMRKQRQ